MTKRGTGRNSGRSMINFGGITMKKLIALVLLSIPMVSLADYVDVIHAKLNPGCSMTTYLAIVKDFNEQWGKGYGYKVEILTPVQSADMTSFYWVGRIASGTGFGKGLDVWHTGVADPNSTEGKLMSRLAACTTTLARSGYFTN